LDCVFFEGLAAVAMIDVRHAALTHGHHPLPGEVVALAHTDAEGKEIEDKLSEEAKMKIGDTGRHAPTPMG
jgi:hypothetical protein